MNGHIELGIGGGFCGSWVLAFSVIRISPFHSLLFAIRPVIEQNITGLERSDSQKFEI